MKPLIPTVDKYTLMQVALQQYGEKEIKGKLHNENIVRYAKEIGLAWVNDDETPWCAIAMGWCLMMAGFKFIKKATARSYLAYGEAVNPPEMFDIVVFKRGTQPWQGHVGFFIRFADDGDIWVYGGNQKDQFCIRKYSVHDLLGFRRPIKIETT